MTRLQQIAEAARENGWETRETSFGPTYTRRTAAITEVIDVSVAVSKHQSFHHAWYIRRSDTVSDARYGGDQFDALLAQFAQET